MALGSTGCRDCGTPHSGGVVRLVQTAEGSRVEEQCWACYEIAHPPDALCCQRAREQGYRRGYEHGYTYALWDMGKLVRWTDHAWAQVETFLYTTLWQWRWRANHAPAGRVAKEGGPRLCLTGDARERAVHE